VQYLLVWLSPVRLQCACIYGAGQSSSHTNTPMQTPVPSTTRTMYGRTSERDSPTPELVDINSETVDDSEMEMDPPKLNDVRIPLLN